MVQRGREALLKIFNTACRSEKRYNFTEQHCKNTTDKKDLDQ